MVILFIAAALTVSMLSLLDFYHLLPERTYRAEDFGIETIRSPYDHDGDGVDDWTDLMLGARAYVETKPVYKSAYYIGGYPPEGEGVCTDVIWKAFEAAGYDLKAMVDQDIREHGALYFGGGGEPDPHIDFRRVKNLKLFLERYALSLATDPDQIKEWQPGDIVVYGISHIAVVSDKRDRNGYPYIIHHGGRPNREEAALMLHAISGHYRIDGSKMEPLLNCRTMLNGQRYKIYIIAFQQEKMNLK